MKVTNDHLVLVDMPDAQAFEPDLDTIREATRILRATADVAEADQCLNRIGVAIGMPMLTWVPDCCDPYYNAEMDDFSKRQGWPEEIRKMWWSDNANIKIPFYRRCGYEHLPFVTSLLPSANERRPGLRQTRVERFALAVNRALGHKSLLTVPVHLPRKQISMLTWAGTPAPLEVEAILKVAESELLAATHYYIALRANASGQGRQRKWTRDDFQRLTPREWDCVRLTAQGHTLPEICKLQETSSTTVRYHLNNAVRKLGATNRTHAVVLAAQMGLLGPIGR